MVSRILSVPRSHIRIENSQDATTTCLQPRRAGVESAGIGTKAHVKDKAETSQHQLASQPKQPYSHSQRVLKSAVHGPGD
jgi:hypothetical protein